MTLETTVRCLEPAELSANARLVAEFFAAEIQDSYITHSDRVAGRPNRPQQSRAELAAAINAELQERSLNDSSLRVFECRSDQVLGYAICSISGEVATLEDIAVRAHIFSRGVGSDLLNHIKTFLGASGVSALYAEVGVGNTRARSFFESRAFVPDSTTYVTSIP